MRFIETRGNDNRKKKKVTFSEAILNPSGSFGGIYVPEKLPSFDIDFLKKHLKSDYKELALDILKSFEVDIEDSTLKEALARYDMFDDSKNPVPLTKVEDDCFVMELYHGPTRAFKDMALQPFGSILSKEAQKRDENYLIMVATSGDTGPATLETFKNQKNIKVVCLYPHGGTSEIQKLQMITEESENIKVLGVKGDFDDTQNSLKTLLSSKEFETELDKNNIKLSVANSVNFGRIIFQIIYHIYGYLELVRRDEIEMGESIYLVVPSGNFGNVLGGYYAKKGGLPIEKLLVASNRNNVLTDWIERGIYDIASRNLVKTKSPAMDILKSSNVERVLFHKFGKERTKELMESLNQNGKYTLTKDELSSLQEDFVAFYSTDEECLDCIAKYAERGYILDPHTATCFKAYKNYKKKKKLKTIIYSTAEWTKFATTMAQALGKEDIKRDIDALEWIKDNMDTTVPEKITHLLSKRIKHHSIIDKNRIRDEVIEFIEVKEKEIH